LVLPPEIPSFPFRPIAPPLYIGLWAVEGRMDRLFGAALVGTGSCLPERAVPNAVVCREADSPDDWVRTRTGIRERRFAGPGETAATLGAEAARRALVAAGVEPSAVDLVVCGTVTPAQMCPSAACLIQAALGCRPVPAFDVSAACSGFLYALGAAAGFIRTGAARTAVVVGAETLSRVIDPADRNTAVLFGDAAGAAVLTATDEPGRGVRALNLFADGTRHELIHLPGPGAIPPGPGLCPSRTVRMSGKEVFRFAVGRLTEMIRRAEAECDELGVELSLVVPHQVNVRLLDAASEATGFPRDRFVTTVERYGNTAAASVPVALDEAVRIGRCGPGDTVLLAAFGGGLTWGSALVTL
jgi:3-oxoacyl-[acyl-carrier-protein] synthase-3